MGIYIAYYILLAALVIVGFGELKTWQRAVATCACFAAAAAVLWVVN